MAAAARRRASGPRGLFSPLDTWIRRPRLRTRTAAPAREQATRRRFRRGRAGRRGRRRGGRRGGRQPRALRRRRRGGGGRKLQRSLERQDGDAAACEAAAQEAKRRRGELHRARGSAALHSRRKPPNSRPLPSAEEDAPERGGDARARRARRAEAAQEALEVLLRQQARARASSPVRAPARRSRTLRRCPTTAAPTSDDLACADPPRGAERAGRARHQAPRDEARRTPRATRRGDGGLHRACSPSRATLRCSRSRGCSPTSTRRSATTRSCAG